MKNVLPVVLSVLAVAAGGCHKSREVTAPNLPPVAVRVETVESRERASTEDVVGTVRPRLHAAIGAKISGRIRQLLVVPGQRVQPGELLAALEAGEMQARLDQALAVRAQAEADLKRYTALYDQKILSPAEFDAAQSRFRIADAAAKEAQAMMDYTRITAPFAGVITRKLADVGDLVGDPTMPNRPILEMEDPTALRLEADVPEAVIGKLAVGDKLPVRIGSLDGELAGVISEIAPAGDPSSRTFLVKLDL
ncbi:MAG: efflux RND transporter periplasmic adaptor subunit, partial [Verrucomicrobiota bacterium]